MTGVYDCDNQDMMGALRRLKDRGEITSEQYAQTLRINKGVASHKSQANFLQSITPIVRKPGIHGNTSFIKLLNSCGVDWVG